MTQVDQTTDYINAVFVNVSIGVLREGLETTTTTDDLCVDFTRLTRGMNYN